MGGRLEGKVALISGGGTGIGAATAALFRDEGAEVIVMGRRREPLEEVAAATGSLVHVGDAGVKADARAAVDLARERFGGLDILVPNAGAPMRGGAGDLSDAEWAASIHANLATVFVLCREALPSIIERRGNIVIVSSLAGIVAPPTLVGYITTKHALTGFTKSMARDYGPVGVRVNSVNPGWVRTAMGDEAMDGISAMSGITRDEAYRLVTKNVPLRRPAEPEEIASICLFLASEESSIITGAIVMADAGASVVDIAMIDVGPTGG